MNIAHFLFVVVMSFFREKIVDFASKSYLFPQVESTSFEVILNNLPISGVRIGRLFLKGIIHEWRAAFPFMSLQSLKELVEDAS